MLAITLLAGAVHAQDPLSAAKELYASAAYDEALAALNRLKAGASPALTIEIDQYRAFCLFALGRTKEAEAVAEGVVRANPLVDVRSEETSPRIVALFTDLQKQMLPGLDSRSLPHSARIDGGSRHRRDARPSSSRSSACS